MCRNVRKRTFGPAPNEDSDQPAHSRSLIKIFTGRILEVFFFIRTMKTPVRLRGYPVPSAHMSQGTQQAHDVNTTSPQRRYNVMTLSRRCINVMCPLGM